MSKNNNTLYVEGDDDLHVIWKLCEIFNVPETFKIKVPQLKDIIKIDDSNVDDDEKKSGIQHVFKAMEFALNEGSDSIQRLGIVIDADENLQKQWNNVKKILRNTNYQELSELPDINGTVLIQEDKPIFGVWIMPDNQLHGMLEDFLSFLVPDKDTNEVWAKAVKSSQEVLQEIDKTKRFPERHLAKAQMHAYLAWQKDSGKPFGQAITAKYLQADNPNCENFVNWLKRLFVE
jgi:hypothetical protein